MKFRLLYVVLITVLCSCNGHRTEENVRFDSNANEMTFNIERNTIKIKDIVDSMEFIPLKLQKGDFIKEIEKVVCKANFIHVLDQKNNSVYSFTHDGEFVDKVACKGNGPKEYSHINDFAVSNDTILILSRDKINFYNVNGEFLKSVRLRFTAVKMECVGQCIALYRECNTALGDEEYFYDLILCDMNGKVISKHIPFSEEYMVTGKPFCWNNDRLYFCSQLSDTVYSIKNASLCPERVIHLHGKNEDKKVPNQKTHKSNFVCDFYDTDQVMCFSVEGEDIGNVCYSKKDSSSVIYNGISADDKFLFQGIGPKTSFNSKLYTVWDPVEFMTALHENPKVLPQMKKHFPHYKDLFTLMEHEDSAPVLIVETLKTSFKN
ncbi:6-bladed beta-propeller [Puteibacter caeruleilacunae]|nr:6-bladed beta-propeller [Puteibacter caeruleilacunae]